MTRAHNTHAQTCMDNIIMVGKIGTEEQKEI